MDIRRRLGVVAVVAVALLAAPAAARACAGLKAAEGVVLQPFLLSAKAKVGVVSAVCGDGVATFDFAVDGQRTATARLSAGADHADARFDFAVAMQDVTYGLEVVVQAQSAELFDVKRTSLRPNGADRATTYYPYDWRTAGKRDVRHADSVIPGFKAGRLNIVYDTPTLGAIALTRKPGRIEALFPVYRHANDKGDKALARHDIAAGDGADMRVYVHAGLAHIQDTRFAVPDRKGMAGAHISQFVPKQWTPDPTVVDRAMLWRDPNGRHCAAKRPDAGRPCFATADEMRAFAAAMPKENSIVIARLALPTKAAATAIRQGGATPYYYLFFGAIGARDGDPSFRDAGLVLEDSAGKPHMAPYSAKSRGNWFLLDLTRADARKYFVDRALEALDNGYGGVFMDGGFLWNMPNGKVGGDNPDATISQYHGRMLLMRELRDAMRARDPAARLGILANAYAEYMHYADWILREGTALHWRNVRALPHLREVAYRPNRKILEIWHSQYGRLIASPVFYACKGPNAVMIRTCRNNLGLDHAGFYYDSGDWDIHDSEIAAMLVRAAYAPGDLYVTRVEKNKKIVGAGVSRLLVENGPARVWFSRAAPLLRRSSWTPLDEARHTYQFAADEAYVPADRVGPDGWTWAMEGFLHRGPNAFVAGDFYVIDAPSAPAPGQLRALLAAVPRVEAAKDTAPAAKVAPPDLAMTLRLALPDGAAWRLETPDGAPARPVRTEEKDGRTIVRLEGHARIALTLSGLKE